MNALAAEALMFECGGQQLLGVFHPASNRTARLAVIVVVGGPQYRVGSHRQFVLMGRMLAAAGFPVLRFDYRGMGDSGGDYAGFEHIAPDLAAAIEAVYARQPGLRGVVLWGLCDGASAALMYAPSDARVAGVIAVNTWARTASGEAQAYIGSYYGQRLLQASFWRKLLRGEVHVGRSVVEFLRTWWRARGRTAAAAESGTSFIDRMRAGLESFGGRVLLLESGRDLTVAEFAALRDSDPRWRRAASRQGVTIRSLPEADHTFSDRRDLDAAVRHCVDWLTGVAAAC